MALHNELGREGEDMAVAYLSEKGYTILHRNWRVRHLEVDIVAMKNNMLRFVEVKCRSSARFGEPEDGVTRKKLQCLMQAADEFLYRFPQHKDFRIDIVAIKLRSARPPEFFLIEDVYL